VAVIVFLSTLPGDFVFDDAVLLEQGVGLEDFSVERVFWGNYWGPARHDVSYRPLTLFSYALNFQISDAPLGFHLVNVLLNGVVAWLSFLLLKELLGHPYLAALGACVCAVLPIHTEVVANIVGRAELLAALAFLVALYCSLRSPVDRRRGVLLTGVAVFLGLAAKESVAAVVPLLLIGPWLLGRPLPWRTFACAVIALSLYLVLRQVVLQDEIQMVQDGRATLTGFIDNPMTSAHSDPLTRMVNATRLLGLYAWKTVVPVHLSADYSFNQIPVLELSDVSLWLQVVGFIAGVLCGVLYFRKRVPEVAFGFAFFPLAFVVTSNVPFAIGTIFGDRLAYVPSLAYPIILCGVFKLGISRGVFPARALYLGLGLLVAIYAVRSVFWSLEWQQKETLYAHMVKASPDSTRAQTTGARLALLRATTAKSQDERAAAYREANAGVDRALSIYPDNHRAHATRGEILLSVGQWLASLKKQTQAQGAFARAETHFDKALELVRQQRLSDPRYLRLRAEARMRQNKLETALGDFDRYIDTRREQGDRPDPTAFNYRGLAKGIGADALRRGGEVQEADALLRLALEDFDAGISADGSIPELYSNRGHCRELLGDQSGALEDYRQGLELCEEQERLDATDGVSVVTFRLRMAKVYRVLGDEAAARREEMQAAEAQKTPRR
jgi:tetratricopeptide (TPR) repeat protein